MHLPSLHILSTNQKSSTLLNTIVKEYYSSTVSSLSENLVKRGIKGKYDSLRYTTEGLDISDLMSEEQLDLLHTLFRLNTENLGLDTAINDLEVIILRIKNRLGSLGEYSELLFKLPEGVLETEKLTNLPHDQLKERALSLYERLEETQKTLNTSVVSRTVEVSAERDILKSILNNTKDGVFSIDTNHKVITYNKIMEKITGYTAEEVIGQKADDFVRLFDNSIEVNSNVYAPSIQLSQDKNVYSHNNLTLVNRNGEKKHIRLVTGAIPEGSNIDIAGIVTVTDVTKEVELERMKLDFVSIAAHELRTPLTALRGYVALLVESAMPKLDEEENDYLQKVSLSANQLHILIENLLNVSRIERGDLNINKQEHDLEELIVTSVAQFEDAAKESNIELTYVKNTYKMPNLMYDEVLIQEVLSNLIDNALNYTNSGGRISIVLEKAEESLIVHIKDTGIGIAESSVPHLFKKFYRASKVLREGRKGTGLGLYISKQIINMHGGRIWVRSKINEGSTFSFSLPLSKSSAN